MTELREAIEAIAETAKTDRWKMASPESREMLDSLTPGWCETDYRPGDGCFRCDMPESVNLNEITTWAAANGLYATIEWNGEGYSDSAHYIEFHWHTASE